MTIALNKSINVDYLKDFDSESFKFTNNSLCDMIDIDDKIRKQAR